MSDWEDEPVCVVPPPSTVEDDGWGDSNPSAKIVSEWSDEEQPASGQREGDGNGYRGRRDGGGDGYRGRRDADGGGGGYRGHRDGEGGGFRGRRDEEGGRGGGGGGYRGRRDDNQDVAQLLCEPSHGIRVPSSYDKEVVRQFINDLDLTSINDLAKLRQLRDYLLEAFKQLVTNEWNSIQEKERDERQRMAYKLRDEAANTDRILNEVNTLLNDTGDTQQRIVMNWLESNMMKDHLQLPTCSRDTFVAPRTPRQSRQITITPMASSSTPPEAPRKRTTRPKRGTGARAEPTLIDNLDDMRLPSQIGDLRLLLKSGAEKYSQCDGNEEIYTAAFASDYQETIMIDTEEPYYPRWVPENFVRRREMRITHYYMPRAMRKEIPLPELRSNSVWFSCKAPAQLDLKLPYTIDNNSRHLSTEHVQQDQTSSMFNLPRQQQSGTRQDSQDYIRLMLDSRENETFVGPATSTPLTALPFDCLPPMEPVTAPQGSQPTLTDEDRSEMQPPLPPLPLESPMDFGSAIMPTSGEKLSIPLSTRSRYAYSSTPLKDYRHQLPPINEEHHQHQRPTTMGRVLELSEHFPPPTPSCPVVAPNETSVNEAVAPPAEDLVSFAAELQLTPCLPRDWNSIFRPRNYMPSYEGLDVEQTRPKQKRKRRVPVHRAINSPEARAAEPRSNHEITTNFLADFVQSAFQDESSLRQVGIDMGQQSEERLNPPATNIQLAQSDLELPQDIALPMELPAMVMETDLISASNVDQVKEIDLELAQTAIVDALLPPAAAEPSAEAATVAKPQAEAAAVAAEEAGAAVEPHAEASTEIPAVPMEVDLPFSSVSLDELPDRPIVTSMRIFTPGEVSSYADKPQFNITGTTSEFPMSAQVTPSTRLMEDSTATQAVNLQKETSAHQQNDEQSTQQDRFYRENIQDLEFIVKHTEKLRLMMDHQKQLSDEQQQHRQPLRDERRGGRGGGGFNRDRGGDFGEKGERRRRGEGDMNNNHEDADGDEKKTREFYIPPEPTKDETELFSTAISSGINFSKYDNIPVKVTGENVPPAIKKFDAANLRSSLLENITKSGYTVPTPIQKVSIPVITEGRDLMACAQTGSGKTAAFLLPILNSILDESIDLEIGKPQAVIVSPTRELAIQIFNEARKFAYTTFLKIKILYGGTSVKYQNESITNGCHVLIATPGRLLDFVERTFVTFEDTRFVVLDEADRMLDMGFADSMRKIMHHQTMRPDHQTLMFSATFPEEIQRLAGEFLKNYIFVTIGVVGGACSDVQQTIYEVNKFNKRSKLMEILREGADGTIVFVETKRGADFLASFFSETEFPTTSIHGDRLQSQREQALRDFKNGNMKVLIATSVASRGLDIKNVKHVINYDMPSNIDDYVHRIGRTGRVGNSGRATSFFDPEHDRALGGDLIKILEGSGQVVPDFLMEMGGGSFSTSKFGGIDVRGGANTQVTNAAADNLEDEEGWD